jgi:hypothetical protein
VRLSLLGCRRSATSRLRGSHLAQGGRLVRASALLLMHGQKSTTTGNGQLPQPGSDDKPCKYGTNATVLIERHCRNGRSLLAVIEIMAAGAGKQLFGAK